MSDSISAPVELQRSCTFVNALPRILKYPPDIKMAYMQQEADLDNTKTAMEDQAVHSLPRGFRGRSITTWRLANGTRPKKVLMSQCIQMLASGAAFGSTQWFALKELLATFGDRTLAEIDADIDAGSSDERLNDLTAYIEERSRAEDHLAEVENMVSKLGLAA